MVVIAIIGLLIGLLLPSLSMARNLAKQMRAQSGLRQMLLGYTTYYHDYNGHVMFGYPPALINGVPLITHTQSGHELGVPVADRYPWRLVPYVGNIWEILHSHSEVPERPEAGDSLSDAFLKAYVLSLSPTFGINSIYVGGHGSGTFQGFVGDRPNIGKHVVFYEHEVISPSNLIAFADSRAHGPGYGQGKSGLHYLTPPHAAGHRWNAAGGNINNLMATTLSGLPLGWYTDAAVTGFFDGHVSMRKPEELDDMRLWANWADSENYDFAP